MVRNLILDEVIEPEAGELRQHAALVGYALAHHHIERGQAVRGDHQQLVAEFVNVADLSPRKELDTGEIRFQQDTIEFMVDMVLGSRALNILKQHEGLSMEKGVGGVSPPTPKERVRGI
jgi:hypothetical protein